MADPFIVTPRDVAWLKSIRIAAPPLLSVENETEDPRDWSTARFVPLPTVVCLCATRAHPRFDPACRLHGGLSEQPVHNLRLTFGPAQTQATGVLTRLGRMVRRLGARKGYGT